MDSQEQTSSEDWLNRADQTLLRGYGIDFDDAGLSAEELRAYCTEWSNPNEFVEWFASKYDLDPIPKYLHRSGRLRSPLKP